MVVAYSAGGAGAITIIPDSVAGDVVETGVDDVQEDGGGGWTTTNSVVTETAAAAPVIDCSMGGSTEVNNEEIPAP